MFTYSIEEIIKIAENRGGRCLSSQFNGVKNKLSWECSKGHQWQSLLHNVLKGHWCPVCGRLNSWDKRGRLTVADLQDMARKRGGDFLSSEYLGYSVKHEWRCADGHIWQTSPDRIAQGHWCHKCSKSKHFTEEKCRYMAEQLTGLKFPSSFGIVEKYELDLYNEQYKIAIEYNGSQHYQFNKNWHRDENGLKEIQTRDQRKLELCKSLNIKFYVIKYDQFKNDEQLINILKSVLVEAHLPIIKQSVTMDGFYEHLSFLKRLKNKARELGGRCLSTSYLGCESKCKFECKCGNVWEAEPRHIFGNHWCPKCGDISIGNKNRKHTIEEMQSYAISRGGKCLSSEFTSINNPLLWGCEVGHQWFSRFSDTKRRKKWCIKCNFFQKFKYDTAKRLTIEEMHEMASKRCGKCLSEEYINSTTKLEWECEHGHRWFARPANIKYGKKSWCPFCSKLETAKKISKTLKLRHEKSTNLGKNDIS